MHFLILLYFKNVFTVTFDQFNAAFLNKTINYFPKQINAKKSYWPQIFGR